MLTPPVLIATIIEFMYVSQILGCVCVVFFLTVLLGLRCCVGFSLPVILSRGYSAVGSPVVAASLVVEPKLSACGLQQLHHRSRAGGSLGLYSAGLQSTAQQVWLSCSEACGSSGTRIKPVSPVHEQADSLPPNRFHGSPCEGLVVIILFYMSESTLQQGFITALLS